MRTHLVTMLDGIGLADTLGLESTAQLFGTHHHLAALCSAIDYPVFVNGRNYGGANPPLTRHPVLRSLVRASLGTRVAMTPDALVIPLGKAAQDAVSLLAADGLLNPGRSLTGFPHSSGGNGHRVRQYAANREALAGQVARWAATTLSSPACRCTRRYLCPRCHQSPPCPCACPPSPASSQVRRDHSVERRQRGAFV